MNIKFYSKTASYHFYVKGSAQKHSLNISVIFRDLPIV